MKEKDTAPREISLAEKITTKFTKWLGTPTSLILHTIFFIGIFGLLNVGWSLEEILLVLTTVVSLEAIYLALFIQMTVNRQEARLHEVGQDIEEISEDVEELQEDVGEIHENVEELGEDVEEISKDVDELSEDFEEDDKEDEAHKGELNKQLKKVETALISLIQEIETMREKK